MTRYVLVAWTLGCLASVATAVEPAEALPPGARVVKLEAHPPRVELKTPFEYSQLLLTAHLAGGEQLDVTRLAKIEAPAPLVRVNDTGVVRPVANGRGALDDPPARADVDAARRGQGPEGQARSQLRPRRDADAVAHGLQRRNVSRSAEGQERLQTVAARLRSDLRPPGADGRSQGPPLQPGRSRRQLDAAQVYRHRRPRRRRADAAGRAVLRPAARLDRRRRQARPERSARPERRGAAPKAPSSRCRA